MVQVSDIVSLAEKTQYIMRPKLFKGDKMSKDRFPKTKKFLSGVADVIEAAAEAKAKEDQKNAEIEEAVELLMESYTGNNLVVVNKKD